MTVNWICLEFFFAYLQPNSKWVNYENMLSRKDLDNKLQLSYYFIFCIFSFFNWIPGCYLFFTMCMTFGKLLTRTETNKLIIYIYFLVLGNYITTCIFYVFNQTEKIIAKLIDNKNTISCSSNTFSQLKSLHTATDRRQMKEKSE